MNKKLNEISSSILSNIIIILDIFFAFQKKNIETQYDLFLNGKKFKHFDKKKELRI